jgi:hypothetical protein
MAQQQTEAPRNDPKSRPIVADSFGQVGGTFKHTRTDRAYVLANPLDDSLGLTYCLEIGYHEVNAKTDKERVALGRVEDSGRVTFRGQVLLWIEKDVYDAHREHGLRVLRAREVAKKNPGGPDNVIDARGKPATQWETKE